ncbi:malectin domain-containing carbohydrate-binding protein [Negadavirga shengliensis]|uniref:Malectin domain-containing carbohydrate-binding protein n=1 Tax=Negadavirga shengliensis TaxID=1389218 RepID=A0ABV9T3G0_9BACT
MNSIIKSLKPGDAVYFRRGETYFGTIHIENSGSPGSPIKFGAYGSGNNPVITSLTPLVGWKSVGNGRFESNQTLNTQDVGIVLINGEKKELGRFPNANEGIEGYVTIERTTGGNSVTGTGFSGSPNWSGGEIVIKKNQWIIDRHKITSHSGSTVNYDRVGSQYTPREGYGFFIQNHLNTLDEPGEWYFDVSKKKLYIYFGSQNPSGTIVQSSTLPHLLTKSYNASHLLIENIHFNGSSKDAINVAGGRDITFRNIFVENAGENGLLSLSVLELLIEDSRIKDCYNNGLFLRFGNAGARVKGNKIENTALIPGRNENGDGNGIGIFAVSDNIIVENNIVENTGFNGINFNGNNTVIKNNFVNTFCLIKGDGGGIYTYGGHNNPDAHSRKITGNIVINGIGSRGGLPNNTAVNFRPLAEGIFLDDNSNGIEIYGNTVAHITNNAIKMSNTYNVVMDNNNLFDSNVLLTLGNSTIGGDARNISVKNNIFFSKRADQNTYAIRSHKDDIRQMADFDLNYLFRPFGDQFFISTRYVNGSGNNVEGIKNLELWRNEFGKDRNSKNNIVEVDQYRINKKIGSNIFANGTFDKNVLGQGCNSCSSSWDSGKINGGTLKVTAPGSSSVRIDVGSLKKDKTYLVKFKSLASKEGNIRTYFRHSESPWQIVSTMTSFELNGKVATYETVLSPVADIEKVSLMIATQETDFTYWIDDLEIMEADVTMVNPDDEIIFEYNTSSTPKTIALGGTYVDATKKEYSGSVTIPSYGSVILIRISNEGAPAIIEETKAPEIQLVLSEDPNNLKEGDDITLKGKITTNGSEIKKVDFYCGLELIASRASEPYEAVWKNIPSGSHYVWASVYDVKGNQAVSQEIAFDVSAPIADIIDPNRLGNPGLSQFYNFGSNQNVFFQNQNFKSENTSFFSSGSKISSNANASDHPIFQTARFASSLGITIPVPNGVYTVQTLHNETYFGKNGPADRAGQRVFDISLQGEVVKKGFDMYAESGNKETVLTFQNIEVKNGQLNINLQASANNATISGIAIVQTSGELGQDKGSDFKLSFNTSNIGNISYLNTDFERLPNDYLLTASSNISSNSSASKDRLFQSGRFAADLKYGIPVPNGTYTVKTYHNETYFGKNGPAARAGQRVFNISMEGNLVKKDFDMFLENDNKETILVFKNIEVRDGSLNIDMIASANNAIISGIAIERQSSDGTAASSGLFLNTGSNREVSFQNITFENTPKYYLLTENANTSNNPSASNEVLFQSGKFASNLRYHIPVPNGTYTVKTYHNETYFGKTGPTARAGQRVFDILIEGKVVRKNLDMYVENGNKETVLIFENIEINDGVVNIDMVASANNAVISGIAIIDESGQNQLGTAHLRGYGETDTYFSESTTEPDNRKSDGMDDVKIFPNPASEKVFIELPMDTEFGKVLIHTTGGRLISQYNLEWIHLEGNKYIIPLDGLSQGVFLLSITEKETIIKRQRLIVNP